MWNYRGLLTSKDGGQQYKLGTVVAVRPQSLNCSVLGVLGTPEESQEGVLYLLSLAKIRNRRTTNRTPRKSAWTERTKVMSQKNRP